MRDFFQEKKYVSNEGLSQQENAAIQYVNFLWASNDKNETVFHSSSVLISADWMGSLTHPPGIEDKDKYVPIEVKN